jgi:hypothetical protein
MHHKFVRSCHSSILVFYLGLSFSSILACPSLLIFYRARLILSTSPHPSSDSTSSIRVPEQIGGRKRPKEAMSFRRPYGEEQEMSPRNDRLGLLLTPLRYTDRTPLSSRYSAAGNGYPSVVQKRPLGRRRIF